jgi:hypothetical protein
MAEQLMFSFAVSEKRCSKCEVVKPLGAFGSDTRRPDGRGSWCKACICVQSSAYYAANTEKVLTRNSAYEAANKEKIARRTNAHYAANKERIQSRNRAHYAANIEELRASNKVYREANKEMVTQGRNRWITANPGKAKASWSKSRAARKRRVPKWANNDAIAAVYDQSSDGHHVDHIVPLQGKNVSGLHVAANLRVVPAHENSSKYNKYEPAWEILRPDLLREVHYG